MCQAYEAEKRMILWIEEMDDLRAAEKKGAQDALIGPPDYNFHRRGNSTYPPWQEQAERYRQGYVSVLKSAGEKEET